MLYQTFSNLIEIPETLLKNWTKSYIDLLRILKLYKLANHCINTSKLNSVKDANKVKIVWFFHKLNLLE